MPLPKPSILARTAIPALHVPVAPPATASDYRKPAQMLENLAHMAKKIKHRRIDLDLRQTELADKMGISCKTMNNIERGVYWPSVPALILCARALQIPLDELV